jgi:hypothetical protein
VELRIPRDLELLEPFGINSRFLYFKCSTLLSAAAATVGAAVVVVVALVAAAKVLFPILARSRN